MPAPTKPLTAVQLQLAYSKMTVEQLLYFCEERLPGFAIDLHIFPKPAGGVMMTWRYNYPTSPVWEWQRTRPEEVRMGGVYQSVRECLVAVLGRVDRFDAWTYEQTQQQKEFDARVRRAAAAAPVDKPTQEQDEGDEVVEVEELPPVTPFPERDDYLAGILKRGTQS